MNYGLVTAARNESRNLARLAECLDRQTTGPFRWIIVENGSTDDTLNVASELARSRDWIRVLSLPGSASYQRGAVIAQALEAGIRLLGDPEPDVVVICDADVSMDSDYFARLLGRFEKDPFLGIASGSRYELCDGRWHQRFLTARSVEGQCRAYRLECLKQALPLERSMGWDGVDQVKANLCGWRTSAFRDLPFRHHRSIGQREGNWRGWISGGAGAHYMGYRPSYLLLRSLFQARRDPAALGLVWGYAQARLRRSPSCPDRHVLNHVRRQQRFRSVLRRAREATGRQAAGEREADLLLVSDPGGHLFELVALSDGLAGFSRAWVTVDSDDSRSLLRGERVYLAHGPTSRNARNLIRNLILAWRVLDEVSPKAVITTGAAIGVPFAWLGRLRAGSIVVFVEISGVVQPTLSCRLVAPIADRVLVQWPELASEVRGATYVGNLFFSE